MASEYNAVFKGGGAKGIAYGGALEACELSDITFKEVAGSSAGAITAALVACGYSGSELIDEMPKALASIDDLTQSMAMIGIRPSLLVSTGLDLWLAKAIALKIDDNYAAAVDRGAEVEVPTCTFADVFARTGIKLYVVTLDLATRQPIVFSPDLTPDSPVAPAVVASSAIPVAFPASRMIVDGEVHRLVDGGTWANYPAFIFHDSDFRHHHDLGERTRPTMGFILDQDEGQAAPRTSPQPKLGSRHFSDKGSSTEQLDLLGAIMSSRLFRWAVAMVPLLFVVLSIVWLRNEMSNQAPLIGSAPEPLHELLLVVIVAIFATTGVFALAISFLVFRFGRAIFDTGIVGASAAMGVGPSVPYWVGSRSAKTTDPHHVAVRIKVPDALTTLNFRPGSDVQAEAREAGFGATIAALTGVSGVEPPEEPNERGDKSAANVERSFRPHLVGYRRVLKPSVFTFRWLLVKVSAVLRWALRQLRDRWYVRAAAIVYSFAGGTTAAFAALEGFSEGQIWTPLFWVGVVGTAVSVGVWLLANVRRKEAQAEQPYKHLSRLPSFVLWSIAGISTLILVFAIVGFLDNGTTSIVAALRTETAIGQIDAQRDTIDDFGEPATAVDITMSRAEVLGEATLTDYLAQLDAEKIRDVRNHRVPSCGGSGEDLCLTFTTERPPKVGDGYEGTAVRFDLDRGLFFLDQDLWEADGGVLNSQTLMLMVMATMTLAFRAMRAARWRDDLAEFVEEAASHDDDDEPAWGPPTESSVDDVAEIL